MNLHAARRGVALVFFLLVHAGLASKSWGLELLQNPGFEVDEAVCGLPDVAGDWGVDYSVITVAEGDVIARTGTRMLKLVSVGFTSAGACGPNNIGQSADVHQLYAVQSTPLKLRWSFYANRSGTTSSGSFKCILNAYTGPLSNFGNTNPIGTAITDDHL